MINLQTELNRLTSGLYCPSIRKLRDELWEDALQPQLDGYIYNIVYDNIRRRSSLSHIAANIRWELFERAK
jgi:hypothetical protein